MQPIVKGPETLPHQRSRYSSGPRGHAAGRPQPVALEVSRYCKRLTRYWEGGVPKSREPFPDARKPWLVFGHGAVRACSALLGPVQLVFLTQLKNHKKEVICVVVKSKTGWKCRRYVELPLHTEPAPGFLGQCVFLRTRFCRKPSTLSPPPPASLRLQRRLLLRWWLRPVSPPLPRSNLKPVAPAPSSSPVLICRSTPASDAALSSVASSPLLLPQRTRRPVVLSPSPTSKNSAPASQSTDVSTSTAARLRSSRSLFFRRAPNPSQQHRW